jgi:hypothetical protein
MGDVIFVGDFTEGQQPIVRQVVDDLQRTGCKLRVSFTHRLHRIHVGGEHAAILRLEETLRSYGHDGLVATRHRRFALNAADKVRARLRRDANTRALAAAKGD